MTISSTMRKAGPYSGTGLVSAYPFAFKIFSASDVLAVLADAAGAETILALDAHYTVLLNADQNANPGGTVTLASPLAVGSTLTVTSSLPYVQQTDLTNNGGFYPRVLTDVFDRLTVFVQQLAESVGRSLKTAISTPNGFDSTLPAPVPYALIGWNADGTGFQNSDPSGTSALASNLADKAGASLVGFIQTGTGAAPRTVQSKLTEIPSVIDFDAIGDGVTDNAPAFLRAVAAANDTTYSEYLIPAGNYRLASSVSVGSKLVCWRFASGGRLSGPGMLEGKVVGGDPGVANGTATYNSSPNRGAVMHVAHGSNSKPTTDGVLPSAYIQRIDRSEAGDGPGSLISALYTVHKRMAGGTGWLYGAYAYVEDASNSGAAQSVAVAGVIHATGNASVWGLYGEAHAHGAGSYAIGCELNAYNWTGSNLDYNYSDPLSGQSSKGLWVIGFGANRNTFGIGIGSGGVSTMWGAGLFMKTFSCKDYGIDLQCTPKTLINFKYGCSTDGTNTTPGGIGLDVGASSVAAYGVLANQCAIHLRNQRLGFGEGSNFGYLTYDSANSFLSVYSSPGVRAAHLNLITGAWVPG